MKKRIVLAATLAAGILWTDAASAQYYKRKTCRDPWVEQVVTEVQGRAPMGEGETGECNIQLYGARWGNQDELRGYVRQALGALKSAGLEYDTPGGLVMRDISFHNRMPAAGMYIGPRASAPSGKAWVIDLANGNVLAIDRKCRPGYTATGFGGSGGCVKGPVPGP